MKRNRFFVFFSLLAALFFAATPALAHANLVRSEPPANSAQKVPPTSVRLWFSETVEPSFSSVSVFNTLGAEIDQRDSHRLREDPTAMGVSLPGLPQGLYTVAWKTVSAVDGHVTGGSFAFTVGDVPLSESSPREVMSLVDTALNNAAAPPLYQVIVRGLNLLLLTLLAGSFTFPMLILLPAVRAVNGDAPLLRVYANYFAQLFRSNAAAPEHAAALQAWETRWLRFTRIIFALYALVTVAALFAQAFAVGNNFAEVGRVLAATRFGSIWLVRAAILVALGVILFRARGHWVGDSRPSILLSVSVLLGFLLLVTQSLNSHDAAITDPPLLPLLADLIHLLGVVIWVGGLVQLIATLPAFLRALPAARQMRMLAAAISSFSLVAFVAVAVIILSGAYSMYLQVGSLEAFFATLYGTTLLVKFVLILPLLALGALNLIVNRVAVSQRSADRVAAFIRGFDVAVAFEVLLAMAVLLAVGVLTSVAPATSAYDPSPALYLETHQVDDLTVTIGVAPGLVGTNDFDVKVQDGAGQPVSDATVVRLNANMVEMSMGIQQVTATAQGNGHYTFHGDLLSMAGTWQIETLIRRAGHDDARTTFALLTLGQRAPQSAPFATIQSPEALAGLGLTLVGFALGTASVLLLKRRRARWVSLVGALAISVVGALVVSQVVANAPTASAVVIPIVPSFAHLQPNPVRPVPAQLAIGKQIYLQNCATCHGADGKGDGPAAANLNPKPADLTIHAPLHTEGDLYWWVTHGISGTAMPAWDPTLSDLQRWQVVAFIKTFGTTTPTPGSSAPVSQTTIIPVDQNAIVQTRQVGGLNITLTATPRAASVSDFDVLLTDAAGNPVDDATRMLLVTGMTNMSHEPNSILAQAAGGGHYRARGPWIYMAGPWQIGLVVTFADGNARTETFRFNVPEIPAPTESVRVDDSPFSVQQVSLLVYPTLMAPTRADIQVKESVRVTAMLMEPDKTRCGGAITLPELGLTTTFTDAGIAELQFVAPRNA
ncbi:MAG: copper resistance protein CopC, partial [Chloroflexota bacterium]|nr:copper resistance protein CopC [Chloroflexota bacterium]